MNRYEIPTHLNVEDKAFAGLTMRQLLTAAVGLALAYGAASEPALPMPVGLVAAGFVLVAVALVALWRPADRPLEDWAFVLLRFWAIPRISVWRPRERALDVRETTPPCEVVVPELAWSTAVTSDGLRESLHPAVPVGEPYATAR